MRYLDGAVIEPRSGTRIDPLPNPVPTAARGGNQPVVRPLVGAEHRWKPVAAFHTSGNTRFDRYPVLFEMVRQAMADRDSPHILSFGCSTGEEIFTLRRYFPTAEIVGIDIKPESIDAARLTLSSLGDSRIEFRVASSTGDERAGEYDAIFALTVFCSGLLRTAAPSSCSGILSFAAFDKEISNFSAALKPGGFLIVAHANFRVDDCTDFAKFEVVKRLGMVDAPGLSRSVYDADERRLPASGDVGGIYRRR